MVAQSVDAIAIVALVLAAEFGVAAAVLAQLAYASSRESEAPDRYSTPAPLAIDFGAGEIHEHGERARAAARAGALQASATSCVVATSLLSLAAAKPTVPTFAVGALGLALAIATTIVSFLRWRGRDQEIAISAAYGAVAVRYKIGGAAAIEAAFEKEYPQFTRQRRRQRARDVDAAPESRS